MAGKKKLLGELESDAALRFKEAEFRAGNSVLKQDTRRQ
jgi:hypothetical protein